MKKLVLIALTMAGAMFATSQAQAGISFSISSGHYGHSRGHYYRPAPVVVVPRYCPPSYGSGHHGYYSRPSYYHRPSYGHHGYSGHHYYRPPSHHGGHGSHYGHSSPYRRWR